MGPTRERWPEHSPTSVRRAASIRSALAVSSSCISSRTPSLWKIFSAPASSRASTIRFCAAWGRRVLSGSQQHTVHKELAGSCRHPPSAPVLGSILQGASPPAQAAPLSHRWPSSTNPPLLSSQPQHCIPLPELRPSASCLHPFHQDPTRSGTSALPSSPCRTWSSSATEQKKWLSPPHLPQPQGV